MSSRQRTTSRSGTLPDVPPVDPWSGLQHLSTRLERLAATDETSWGRAWELIERIDRAGRSTADDLLQKYLLGTQGSEDACDDRSWNEVTDYLDKLAEGYHWCLKLYERDAACTDGEALARIAACAIGVSSARLKWAFLAYDPVAPAQWQALKRAYLLANNAGVAQHEVVLPGVTSDATTVEREFLKAMALAASSPGGLLPVQVEVAERLVAWCAFDFTLAPPSFAGAGYLIDLTTPDGPQRRLPDRALTPAVRVVVLSSGAATLRRLAAELDSGSVTADDLGLDPRLSGQLLRGTVSHLLCQWGQATHRRRNVRSREAARAQVVHGFAAVAAKVVGASVQDAAAGDEENWSVENRGAGGLLALISRPYSRWIRVGALIAFRYSELPLWHAGVIRRVERVGSESRRVGVERLLTETSGVVLVPRFQSREGEPCADTVGMLLLDPTAVADQVTLLLPAATFSGSAPLQMYAGPRGCMLVPQELLESGRDYQIARYTRLGTA